MIVDHPQLLVGENLIGALDFLEQFLVASLVGVMLDAKLAESLFDLHIGGLSADFKHCSNMVCQILLVEAGASKN